MAISARRQGARAGRGRPFLPDALPCLFSDENDRSVGRVGEGARPTDRPAVSQRMRQRPGSKRRSLLSLPSENHTFRTIAKTYQTTVAVSRTFFLIIYLTYQDGKST